MKNKLKNRLKSKAVNLLPYVLTFVLSVTLGILLPRGNCHAEELPAKERPIEVIIAPIVFDETTVTEWKAAQSMLFGASNSDIYIRTYGFGGSSTMINEFIQAMKDSKLVGNKIIMDVIGPSGSGHALILCYADQLIIRDGASVLFHQAYYMSEAAFGFLAFRHIGEDYFSSPMINTMYNDCVKKGLLTKEDVDHIKSGGDIVLYREDGVLKKATTSDSLSFLGFTIPNLLIKISDILALLLILAGIVFVIKRVK